jgi:hypothetical protein
MVVLLGGLALLGGMGWQVGLTGLWASLQTIGPWIVPFVLNGPNLAKLQIVANETQRAPQQS